MSPCHVIQEVSIPVSMYGAASQPRRESSKRQHQLGHFRGCTLYTTSARSSPAQHGDDSTSPLPFKLESARKCAGGVCSRTPLTCLPEALVCWSPIGCAKRWPAEAQSAAGSVGLPKLGRRRSWSAGPVAPNQLRWPLAASAGAQSAALGAGGVCWHFMRCVCRRGAWSAGGACRSLGRARRPRRR